jgi:DNA-binding transcriptional MerR regulator
MERDINGVGQAMDGLSIGQVASSFGLRTSTVRYYEREGLIPKPARKSGRRVYGPDVRDHLLFVRLALDSGFHIAEIRALVKGMTPASKPGERWRSVAATKLRQIDREIESLKPKANGHRHAQVQRGRRPPSMTAPRSVFARPGEAPLAGTRPNGRV